VSFRAERQHVILSDSEGSLPNGARLSVHAVRGRRGRGASNFSDLPDRAECIQRALLERARLGKDPSLPSSHPPNAQDDIASSGEGRINPFGPIINLVKSPLDLAALSHLSHGLPAARIRVGFPFWLAPFMARNVLAITLGRRIYLSGVLLEAGREKLESTIRHELEHVRQVQRHGLIRFLYRYLRDYIRLRRQGLDSSAAYDAIPFEVEARKAEFGLPPSENL